LSTAAVRLTVAIVMLPVAMAAQNARPASRPNLEGVWNSATATPIERPAHLKDKPFFTPQEAAEWERQYAERNAEPTPEAAAKSKGTGTYNTFFREYGTRVVKTLRTSIITEPADGRIPPLTPAAEALRRRRVEQIRTMANPEGLGLQDQCLTFLSSGPPLLPYTYNSNYQIVQTSNVIVVHAEMLPEARLIYLDGRPHPPPDFKLWTGHSVGRWEGSTLVVDTTNFIDGRGFYGDAGGNFAWDGHLRLTERFSLLDPETLLYQFEIDNPTAYTRRWKGELTMTRTNDRIYEFACHEANYSLENMLRGQRASEGKPVRRPQR
jgi:hypothetical protein